MRNLFLIINLLIATSIFAQNYGTVSGTILDSDKNPVPFANIFIENLKKGGMADEFGKYTLTEVPYGDWQIKVSSVGFRTIKFPITVSSANIDNQVIKLSMDNPLSEVEVFGRRLSHPDKIEAFGALRTDSEYIGHFRETNNKSRCPYHFRSYQKRSRSIYFCHLWQQT